MNTTHHRATVGAGAIALAIGLLITTPAGAVPVVAPAFSGVYSIESLGAVAGLPGPYGGLAFIDNNTLLIGGGANELEGRLYTIDVLRDGDGHISGFAGIATQFGSIGEFNDGGVVFGPGGVLFTARWPVNELGQTLPGDLDETRITSLDGLGIAPSPGGLMFVPPGLPGEGQLKLVSWEGGEWYTLSLMLAPDGTYDILAAVLGVTLAGGPEGIAYVPPGSPLFANPSVLISEYSAGNVAVYEVDAAGDPIIATRLDFVLGLEGAEGAVVDPVTGDFLFSTFLLDGGDEVLRVRGFVPPRPVPEPGSLALLVLGLAGLGLTRRRTER